MWVVGVVLVFSSLYNLLSARLGKFAPFASFASFVSLISVFVSGCISAYYALAYAESGIGFSYAYLHFYADKMTLYFGVLVCLVSLVVHIYSLWYIPKPLYFSYIGMFTLAMLGLIWADHLILFYVFWEWVGVCSYLLIGYYHQKKKARSNASHAFIVNRFGDVALLIAIALIYVHTQTFRIQELNANLANITNVTNTTNIIGDISPVVAWGFLIAALVKSAQLPFSAWLPGAMVGPTPASALIHAATMVTAGVYLLIQFNAFIPQTVWLIAMPIMASTALLSALAACFQTNIKKLLAYSTISHLSYMMIAVAAGSLEAGWVHLFSHACFKAALFLLAGMVIYQYDTQKLKRLKLLSRTYSPFFKVMFICFAASLMGVPFTSGFTSKELVLQAVRDKSTSIFIIMLITSFLSAYYTARMLIALFFKSQKQKPSKVGKAKIPPPSYVYIGIALLLPACFLAPFLEYETRIESTTMYSSLVVLTLGLYIAYHLEFNETQGSFEKLKVLASNQLYLEEIFNFVSLLLFSILKIIFLSIEAILKITTQIFIFLYLSLARLCRFVDVLITHNIVMGSVGVLRRFGTLLSYTQNVQVQYRVITLLGSLFIIAYLILNI